MNHFFPSNVYFQKANILLFMSKTVFSLNSFFEYYSSSRNDSAMDKKNSSQSRRSFINNLSKSVAAAALLPAIGNAASSESVIELIRNKKISANDHIQIALIGAGGMGTADANTAITLPGINSNNPVVIVFQPSDVVVISSNPYISVSNVANRINIASVCYFFPANLFRAHIINSSKL